MFCRASSHKLCSPVVCQSSLWALWTRWPSMRGLLLSKWWGNLHEAMTKHLPLLSPPTFHSSLSRVKYWTRRFEGTLNIILISSFLLLQVLVQHFLYVPGREPNSENTRGIRVKLLFLGCWLSRHWFLKPHCLNSSFPSPRTLSVQQNSSGTHNRHRSTASRHVRWALIH